MLSLYGQNSRTDHLTFKQLDFISDSGWILEDKVITESFQLESTSGIVSSLDPQYLLTIEIALSGLKDIYYRSYIKVQAVLANMGGFIKSIITIFSLLNTYFANKSLVQNLLLKQVSFINKFHKESESMQSSHPIKDMGNTSVNINTITNTFANTNTNANPNANPNINTNNEVRSINTRVRIHPNAGNYNNFMAKSSQYKVPARSSVLQPSSVIKYQKQRCSSWLLSMSCKTNKQQIANRRIFNAFNRLIRKRLDISAIIKLSDHINVLDSLLLSIPGQSVKKLAVDIRCLKELDEMRFNTSDIEIVENNISKINSLNDDSALEHKLIEMIDI